MLRNSELRNYFTKALDSLRRYPLPLESGKECIILQHFGTKLCSMLDKKLEEHKKQESTKVVDVCFSEVNNKDEHITALRKNSVKECEIVEVQDKTVVKQGKNTKKNELNKLVNINEITFREVSRQISLELGIFDIILLVDTQETCG